MAKINFKGRGYISCSLAAVTSEKESIDFDIHPDGLINFDIGSYHNSGTVYFNTSVKELKQIIKLYEDHKDEFEKSD